MTFEQTHVFRFATDILSCRGFVGKEDRADVWRSTIHMAVVIVSFGKIADRLAERKSCRCASHVLQYAFETLRLFGTLYHSMDCL